MTVQYSHRGSSLHPAPRGARGWRLLPVAVACSLLGCGSFSDRYRDKAAEARARNQPEVATANYDRALTTFDAPSDGPDHQNLVVARDEAARTWVRREITSALAGMSEMNVVERLTRIRTARKTAEDRKLDDVRAEADAAASKALEIIVGVIKALTETGELHGAAVLARALNSLAPPLAAHSAEIEKLDKDARDKARAMYMKLLEELNADPQDDVAGKLLVTAMAKFYGATVPDVDRSKIDYEALIGWTVVSSSGCPDLTDYAKEKFAARDAAVKGTLVLSLSCSRWDNTEHSTRTMTVYDSVSRTVHVPDESCIRKPTTFHQLYDTTENGVTTQKSDVSASQEICYDTSRAAEVTEEVPREVDVYSSWRNVGSEVRGKVSIEVSALNVSESKAISARYSEGFDALKPGGSSNAGFRAITEAKKELNALYEKASSPIGHKHIALARAHAAAGRLKDAQREYVIAVVAGNFGDPPDALAGFIASRYRMTRADFDSFARYGTPDEITFDGGSLVAPGSDPQVGSDYADEVEERRSFEGQNAIRAGVLMSVAGLTANLPARSGDPAFGLGLGLALGFGSASGKTLGFLWEGRLAIGGKKSETDAFATDASLFMGPGLRLPFAGLYGVGGASMDYLGGATNSAIVPLGVALGYGGRLFLLSSGSWALDVTGLRYQRVASITPDDPINAISMIYKAELKLRLFDDSSDELPWTLGAFWHGHMAPGDAMAPGVVGPEELRSMSIGGAIGVGY